MYNNIRNSKNTQNEKIQYKYITRDDLITSLQFHELHAYHTIRNIVQILLSHSIMYIML